MNVEKTEQEEIRGAVRLLVESIESGREFVMDQAPLLIQEVVLEGRVYYGTVIVGTAIILAVGITLVTKAIRRLSADPASNAGFVFMMAGTLTSFFSGLLFVFHFSNAVKVFVAPRMYVLEWARDLAG